MGRVGVTCGVGGDDSEGGAGGDDTCNVMQWLGKEKGGKGR